MHLPRARVAAGSESVREYALEVFDTLGTRVATEPVRVTEQPGRTVLYRLASRYVLGRSAAAGALLEGRKVRGLFIGPDLLPGEAVGISGNSLDEGTWLTTSAKIVPAVRCLFGPDAFLRQVDMRSAWVAMLFMRFEGTVGVTSRSLGGTEVFEVVHNDMRYFYSSTRGGWALHGAGSVSDHAIEHALSNGVKSAEDLFWAIGAIKLR